jgi:purine-binding chemotaxis protein CheW
MDAATGAILERRARRLATIEPVQAAGDDAVRVVVVAVAGERYALALDHVEEIEPLTETTPVPGSPAQWLGLLNLRGRTCPVLDLRLALGLGAAQEPGAIVVVVRAGRAEAGMLVERVSEIREIRLSALSPALPPSADGAPDCWTGITPDLVCVLDPLRLLAASGLETG